MGAACRQSTRQYSRREPDKSLLYQVVRDNWETFKSKRELEGRFLPEYVIREFEAYLKCGLPQYGFLRLKCKDCSEEKVVAFSCKKKGFCISCAGKRQVECASHLIDNVLPFVPYRQVVVSFPIPLRHWMNWNKKLLGKIHRLVIDEISRYYMGKAKELGIHSPKPGSITFLQRFGSAADLNIHAHILCADGVWYESGDDIRFKKLDKMSEKEAEALTIAIAVRVISYLRRKKYLDNDGELVLQPAADPLFSENEVIAHSQNASIQHRIAFGPNAGGFVRKIGSGFGYSSDRPEHPKKMTYKVHGFSVHAGTTIGTHSRKRLFEMLEYLARGPLSENRLELTSYGQIRLKLKTPWDNGNTTHLEFTPEEFMEKLVALVPQPGQSWTRWNGVFASSSPLRRRIVLRPDIKKGMSFGDDDGMTKGSLKNSNWAKNLARTFEIDVKICTNCGGELYPVAAVKDHIEAARYLKHVGLPYELPQRAPPRQVEESLLFDA